MNHRCFWASDKVKYCPCWPGLGGAAGTFIRSAGLSSQAIGISSVFSFTWILELDARGLSLKKLLLLGNSNTKVSLNIQQFING